MKNDSEEIKKIFLDSENILKSNLKIINENQFLEKSLFHKN